MLGEVSVDRALLAAPSRQSPLALLFIAWRTFRQFQTIGIGAVVLLFTGRLSGALLGAAIALACISVVVSILAWWRYIFYVERDELVVTKGVLGVERLSIPLNRVQSASIEQKFVHQLVGLVSVAIDTAGSSDSEFEIDAISRSKAEALQRLVSASSEVVARSSSSETASYDSEGAGFTPPGAAVDEVIVRRGWRDLVRMGLARWPWAGFIAFVPLVTLADDLVDYLDVDFAGDDLPVTVDLNAGFFLAVAAVLLAITALGAVLQIGRQFLSNWDLTLLLSGNGLRRTAGLFNKTSRASSLTRIQSLKVHQSVLHRLFKIRKVELATIGDGDLQIPGADATEVNRIRELAFRSPVAPALDRSVSPIMILRETRVVSLMVIGACIAIVAGEAPGWAFAVVVAVPVQLVASYWKWRKRRWSYTPTKLAELRRFFDTDTTELEPFKAQTVEVAQSIFERRQGLATITVRLAEGQLSIPLIGEAEARQIRDSILYQAETDPRAWM